MGERLAYAGPDDGVVAPVERPVRHAAGDDPQDHGDDGQRAEDGRGRHQGHLPGFLEGEDNDHKGCATNVAGDILGRKWKQVLE